MNSVVMKVGAIIIVLVSVVAVYGAGDAIFGNAEDSSEDTSDGIKGDLNCIFAGSGPNEDVDKCTKTDSGGSGS